MGKDSLGALERISEPGRNWNENAIEKFEEEQKEGIDEIKGKIGEVVRISCRAEINFKTHSFSKACLQRLTFRLSKNFLNKLL